MNNTMPVRLDGIQPVTFRASEVIPQYCAVQLDTNEADRCILAVGPALVIGFTQRAAELDETVAVKCDGFTLATAGAGFVVGDELRLGTGGKLIAATSGTEAIAIALQEATADGDIVEVKMIGPKTLP